MTDNSERSNGVGIDPYTRQKLIEGSIQNVIRFFSTSRLPLRPCLHPLQWCDSTTTFLNLPPPYLFDLQDAKSLDRRGKEWDKTLRQFL